MSAQATIKPEKPAAPRMRPNPYGWFLLFLLIWIPLAAVVTANNFLWILFTFMAGVAVVSHVLGKRNISSLRVARRFPDEIYADTPFYVNYSASSSGKRWGSFGFTLTEQGALKGPSPDVKFPQVRPTETDKASADFSIGRRGDHKIGSARISSTFPFGLATYWRPMDSHNSVLVFPKVEALDDETLAWLGGAGRGHERPDPFGVAPFLFRDYVPGDRYKHIDWKKTARTGGLITRVLSDEGSREVTIRLPAGASERAISRAASLIAHLTRTGVPVALEGPGIKIEPGVGWDFARKLLTLLARWDNPDVREFARPRTDGFTVEIDPDGSFNWKQAGEAHEAAS